MSMLAWLVPILIIFMLHSTFHKMIWAQQKICIYNNQEQFIQQFLIIWILDKNDSYFWPCN